jgi:hypothetical protein
MPRARPWSFTFTATKRHDPPMSRMPRACLVEPLAPCYQERIIFLKMPRACPVEPHARCSPRKNYLSQDATGLSRGASRSLLTTGATPASSLILYILKSCRRSGEREAPRDKPVASSTLGGRIVGSSEREDSTGQARGILNIGGSYRLVAASVKLHGASPWHPQD